MRERAGGRKGTVEVRARCRAATCGAKTKKKATARSGHSPSSPPSPRAAPRLAQPGTKPELGAASACGSGGRAGGGLNKDASNLRTAIEKMPRYILSPTRPLKINNNTYQTLRIDKNAYKALRINNGNGAYYNAQDLDLVQCLLGCTVRPKIWLSGP